LFNGFKGVEIVLLDRNSLTFVPDLFFRGLTNLKTASFYANSITSIEKIIFEGHTKVEFIDFGLNSISSITDVNIFQGLTSLKTISFAANPLTSIANVFVGLASLVLINLSHIPVLPTNIQTTLTNGNLIQFLSKFYEIFFFY
jgi:hypothetical protein